MAEALARLRERWPSVEEAKLVAHVAWGANPGAASPAAFPPSVSDSERRAADLIATCAASPLDPPPPRPVYAAFDGAGRSDPAAKDSAWAAERGKRFRSFVEASEEKRAVVAPHELLLVDETTGDVLEGASSNLVAFVDGVAYTADEGVLRGSVRDVAPTRSSSRASDASSPRPRAASRARRGGRARSSAARRGWRSRWTG